MFLTSECFLDPTAEPKLAIFVNYAVMTFRLWNKIIRILIYISISIFESYFSHHFSHLDGDSLSEASLCV